MSFYIQPKALKLNTTFMRKGKVPLSTATSHIVIHFIAREKVQYPCKCNTVAVIFYV